MAIKLMMNHSELQNIISQFHQITAEREALTQRTQALLNTLNNAWQGDSATVFNDSINSLIQDDQRKIQSLRMLVLELSRVSDNMMASDADLASKIANNFLG